MGNYQSTTARVTAALTPLSAFPAMPTTSAVLMSPAVPAILSTMSTVVVVSTYTLSPTSSAANKAAPSATTQIETFLESIPTTTTIFGSPSLTTATVFVTITSSPTGSPVPAVEGAGMEPSHSTSAISAAAAAAAQSATIPSESAPTLSTVGAGLAVSNSTPNLTEKQMKGPFAPPDALLGGVPTKSLDVPITAVFLVLFIMGAATHFITHELNSKKGHKFHLSDMVFDFCMVRTVTCTMRIVWAFRPNNNSIVLAALIFENAGVVVLFAVNVIFTQRILRAIHPKTFWSKPVSRFFFAILASVPMIIVWNIVNLVVSFYTLNTKTIETTKDLLLFGSSYTLFLSVFPIIFGLIALIPSPSEIEYFGTGRFRTKLIVLIFASAMLMVGAIVRIIANVTVYPKKAPGVIDSKATFYTTGFMLEIIVVAMYALVRVDKRFWVPDGSSGPGDYSRKESDEEKLYEDVDVKLRVSVSSIIQR